jgi:alpha-1,6-mannosyltransferase
MFKQPTSSIGFYTIAGLSLAGYILLGYSTDRMNFPQLIALFGLLFLGYIYLTRANLKEGFIKQGILLSVLFRLSLVFMIPNLSDDYFRFIWDGRLLAHSINPFVVMPSTFINSPEAAIAGLNYKLFSSMNSQGYYSIYPPVLQFIFFVSAKCFSSNILGSVILMRVFILSAEIGSIFLLSEILRKMNLPAKNVLFYALNPLVIIELTGNLHFEALMIFFLLLSFFLLLKEQFTLSAIAFSLAICSKLLPLMLLPLLLKKIGFGKSMRFYFICGITTILLFVPFISRESIGNILSSVGLYFHSFEFNASIFYIVRWAGFEKLGYDVIGKAGTILSLIAMLAIFSIAIFQKGKDLRSLFPAMLFGLTFYFAFATIVHPWYISTLVALSVFTTFRFPLIWSGLITLTYFTYRSIPYSESLLLVAIEYLFLYFFMVYELKESRKHALLQ